MKLKHYNITAITIQRDYIPEVDIKCGDCHKCCISLSPNLTQEEFESGKYIYTFLTSGIDKPIIAVPRLNDKCIYFIDEKCSIYDDRPKACRQFDCRKGHYPPLKDHALEKFGEYCEEI